MPNLAISVHVELNVQVELECSSLDAPLNSADQSICGAAGELALSSRSVSPISTGASGT